jgi:endo-1,3(4)-beta-glucanase
VVVALAILLAVALIAAVLARCGSRSTTRKNGSVTLCQDRPMVVSARSSDTLARSALPTNQWWSSLLADKPQTLWAQPIVVSWVASGVEVALPKPNAVANAIVSGRTTPITLLIADPNPTIESYGDFHVDVALRSQVAATRSGVLTVAQGSPATWWTTTDSTVSIRVPDGAVVTFNNTSLTTGAVRSDQIEIDVPDGSAWSVVTLKAVTWSLSGNVLSAAVASGTTMGLVARPTEPTAAWPAIAKRVGTHRVTATTAMWQREPGAIVQKLSWRGGVGVAVLLPHQVTSLTRSIGWFATARGRMTLVEGDTASWSAPLPGVLLGVPELGAQVRTEVAATLAAEPTPVIPAGSYFGAKAIGTSATLADLGTRTKSADAAARLDRLAAAVTKALGKIGNGADRWMAYDSERGGMIAYPPEFGAERYNDHNLQNGYLLAAAATLAEAGHPSLAALRPTIDMIVADLGVGGCTAGFPPFRVMNAYEGHSYADGFAPFADGNNQESSSEAIHAWWALTRWAAATGQRALYDAALAFYATEAETARWYWLGEKGTRAEGYAHRVAGIVWGAKIDFATFFDARPASVVGIQLLPFSFGSLYRMNSVEATARFAAGSADSGDRWSDLLALDLALADPTRARDVVARAAALEEGNTRSFSAAWLGFLATSGPPDASVVADPPIGMAFRNGAGPTTVAVVNPWPTAQTVTFTRDGAKIATVKVAARGATTAVVA